jgi:hypothetical protein
MLKAVITLTTCFITLFCPVLALNAASADCPIQSVSNDPQDIVLQGIGNSPELSKQAALENLTLYLGDSHIDSQYLQQNRDDSPTIESYSSVSSQQQVAFSQLEQQTVPCKTGQYISYLVYDPRSIEQKIASELAPFPVKLSGPAFLLSSPVFSSVLQSSQGPIVSVSLLWHVNGFRLLLGTRQIALNLTELQRILEFVQQPSANLIARQRWQLSKKQTPVFSSVELRMKPIIKVPQGLIACQWNSVCQVIGLSLQPEQAYQLYLPHAVLGNSQVILFSLDTSHPLIQTNHPLSATDFVQLVNLSFGQQAQASAQVLNITGNF